VPTTQQHGFLTWKAPGKLPHVQLDWIVIERMTVDVMRGFGVTRRRGTEVGGILLGKIETGAEPVVRVFDYETVPCEYSQGPSYLLSEHELETFRAAIARWRREMSPDRYPVGYFRSHTRDGLLIDAEDVRLFHEHFQDPRAIALIVKPYATRACEAGIFVQSDGKLFAGASPLEFPFVRSQESPEPQESKQKIADQPGPTATTLTQPPPVQPAPAPAAVPPVPVKPAPVQPAPIQPAPVEPSPTRVAPPADLPRPPQPERKRVEPAPLRVETTPERARELWAPRIDRPSPPPSPPMFGHYMVEEPVWKIRFLWILFTLAVFGFGAIAGYEYAGGQLQPLRVISAEPKRLADPYSVNLAATVQDDNILLRWDRDSDAIKAAMRGVLTITEGIASREVKLDFPELRNGTVLYHRNGPEIGFKLELYFKDNRVFTESVTLKLGP
jgi:hypothetical protein